MPGRRPAALEGQALGRLAVRDPCRRSSRRTGRRGDVPCSSAPAVRLVASPSTGIGVPFARAICSVSSPHPAVAAAPSSSSFVEGPWGRPAAASMRPAGASDRGVLGRCCDPNNDTLRGVGRQALKHKMLWSFRACRPLDVVVSRVSTHDRRSSTFDGLAVHSGRAASTCVGAVIHRVSTDGNRTGVLFGQELHRSTGMAGRHIRMRCLLVGRWHELGCVRKSCQRWPPGLPYRSGTQVLPDNCR